MDNDSYVYDENSYIYELNYTDDDYEDIYFNFFYEEDK